ncbi:hypothetical protein ALC60_08755 [Trachymyrmex zeteki]|uniref:Uncharacterized protein n=1 Tax=Mycetomoellerius zeteki TaxID=64791 RepID=A0A151WW98_9HYME|nr:hypothetical protein ALC60_08755 [Trachymyrmex zeteki]
MVMRKRRLGYNIRPAEDQQVESCQDVTHFVRRFVDSAFISAMKIVAVMALRNWMFHVKFISLNKEGTAEFYVYHVLWSIPTPAYPEPYVTVSVFFCIAASRVQPPHFPVDVRRGIARYIWTKTIGHVGLLRDERSEKGDDRWTLRDQRATGIVKISGPSMAPPPSPYMATSRAYTRLLRKRDIESKRKRGEKKGNNNNRSLLGTS